MAVRLFTDWASNFRWPGEARLLHPWTTSGSTGSCRCAWPEKSSSGWSAVLPIVGADAVDYRCRSGRWSRLAPAVYLMTPPVAPWDRLHVAFLHAGPASVISGSAALFARDLRAARAPATVLTLVPLRAGAANWGTIRVRRTARLPEARWRMGVPLAPVARAVADYALDPRQADRVQAVVARRYSVSYARPRTWRRNWNRDPPGQPTVP